MFVIFIYGETGNTYVRFEVFMAVAMKNAVF
jgi:hypothetical protein